MRSKVCLNTWPRLWTPAIKVFLPLWTRVMSRTPIAPAWRASLLLNFLSGLSYFSIGPKTLWSSNAHLIRCPNAWCQKPLTYHNKLNLVILKTLYATWSHRNQTLRLFVIASNSSNQGNNPIMLYLESHDITLAIS